MWTNTATHIGWFLFAIGFLVLVLRRRREAQNDAVEATVYLGNTETIIVPRTRRIDLGADMITLPEQRHRESREQPHP